MPTLEEASKVVVLALALIHLPVKDGCTLPYIRYCFARLTRFYSPRNGKNITPAQVESALKNILHMSSPLASSLANMLKQISRADGSFDLVDVRKHNVLEHDASFTRHDIIQGDNFTFQPALVSYDRVEERVPVLLCSSVAPLQPKPLHSLKVNKANIATMIPVRSPLERRRRRASHYQVSR